MMSDRVILTKYLPEPAVPVILEWLKVQKAQLKITRGRNTKLGDYRPPLKYKFHRISVNHNLNKYHFLITLVHEFAHLTNWEKNRNQVKPHGNEWKREFGELMQNFIAADIFPADIYPVLNRFLKNPTSTSANTELTRKLRSYDNSAKLRTPDLVGQK